MILPLRNTTRLREQLGPLYLGEPVCRVCRGRQASSELTGLSPFAGDVFRKGGQRVASVIPTASPVRASHAPTHRHRGPGAVEVLFEDAGRNVPNGQC